MSFQRRTIWSGKAKLGDQLETLVNGATFANDTLSGVMNGDINLPDVGREGYVRDLPVDRTLEGQMRRKQLCRS